MYVFEELLPDFELAFDCKITIHDLARIFYDSNKKSLINPIRYSHRKTFADCSEESWTYCQNHCMYQINKEIERTHKVSFIKHCRNGLIEVVVPLYLMQTHVATLFAGIWSSRHKKGNTRREPANPASIMRICRMLPVFGSGLLSRAEFIRSGGGEAEFSRKAEIKNFISKNFRRDVSLKKLSVKIGVSESRACHLVKELFGKTFSQLLTDERLEHARQVLIGTDYRMNEISVFTGFGSAEHFSRMFRKHCGITPCEYRRRYKLNI
jgi:AraC-like DNA-binding protein